MMALQSGTLELQLAAAMSLKASCHLPLAVWLELAGEAERWLHHLHASALCQKAGMLLHAVVLVVHSLCSCGMSSDDNAENASLSGSASDAAKEVHWVC